MYGLRHALDEQYGQAIRQYLKALLEQSGIPTEIAVVVGYAMAVLFIWFVVRAIFGLFEKPKEPDWSVLNPEDAALMSRSFKNWNLSYALARNLQEEMASTVEEFTDQIRRMKAFGKSTIWHRMNLADEELLRSVWSKQGAAKAVARVAREKPAATIEAFKAQLCRLQNPPVRNNE